MDIVKDLQSLKLSAGALQAEISRILMKGEVSFADVSNLYGYAEAIASQQRQIERKYAVFTKEGKVDA